MNESNEWILLLAASILALVLVVLVVWWQYRRKNPKLRKAAPRDSMASKAVNVAASFARGHKFHFITPAHMARGGAFAQLDAVIIGYFGVMGIKALGYNGEIYGALSDAEWVQISPAGERASFPNPMIEASADVRVIRDALFATKQKRIPVEVVCVFTNPTAQLALPRGTGHYTLKEFKALLRKDKYLNDVGLDMDDVKAAISAVIVP